MNTPNALTSAGNQFIHVNLQILIIGKWYLVQVFLVVKALGGRRRNIAELIPSITGRR